MYFIGPGGMKTQTIMITDEITIFEIEINKNKLAKTKLL
jgi:hypothetical protein